MFSDKREEVGKGNGGREMEGEREKDVWEGGLGGGWGQDRREGMVQEYWALIPPAPPYPRGQQLGEGNGKESSSEKADQALVAPTLSTLFSSTSSTSYTSSIAPSPSPSSSAWDHMSMLRLHDRDELLGDILDRDREGEGEGVSVSVSAGVGVGVGVGVDVGDVKGVRGEGGEGEGEGEEEGEDGEDGEKQAKGEEGEDEQKEDDLLTVTILMRFLDQSLQVRIV